MYAVIDDGVNPAVVDYSDGPVTVNHTTHFSTIWFGNPYYRMSLWTFGAALDGVDLDVDDEIAVFDGEDCVGLGVVDGPISYEAPLLIHCSMDDGSGNGFTDGNAISFKIWDASEGREIVIITPQFLDIGTGNPISPPTFGNLMDYGLELGGFTTVSQSIPLVAGWNIFSSYVSPENPGMMNMVQPLIDSGALVKVVAENGSALMWAMNQWTDNIGDFDAGKGYLINMAVPGSLVVEGVPTPLPATFSLTPGWNLISYPSGAPVDAMSVFQPLIDAGVLVKVVAQNGNSILWAMNTWKNWIGDLQPGQGYNVQVSANANLTIDGAMPAPDGMQGDVVQNVQADGAATHFTLPYVGNPYYRMSLWITHVDGVDLSPGDEIAIFDGDLCVGVN
ncbi:MAG: hypothetical protein GY859_24870, partial [Desulfobacterales bacterium]|nr:hypothetical protein [Desulfobacterales bacterium]